MKENNNIDYNEFKENDSVDDYSLWNDFLYFIKVRYRIIKRKIRHNQKKKAVFNRIIYITTKNIPFNYITLLQKQYPDKLIEVIRPGTKLKIVLLILNIMLKTK